MPDNFFFKRKGPFKLNELFNVTNKTNDIFTDIKTLDKASSNEITFFDSSTYKSLANKTKSKVCITTDKLKHSLPKTCKPIIVKNVLYDVARVLNIFYEKADIDYPDQSLTAPDKSNYLHVKFGNNVFIGKNVNLGDKTYIGSNTIIEQGVQIGKNCIIGSHVFIKNSIIGDNVVIQSGCKIGLKGFGFIPVKEKNIKFPHIGKVIIKNNVEIASSCTLDRGSVDDTIIGENTYLDNQVHVAHNVKIGKNCMIAGQVGLAGSSIIGDDCSIGGQAGISGHLRIGNNVKIGGGSGVVNNVPNNTVVMGYPAVPLREFLKNKKRKKN